MGFGEKHSGFLLMYFNDGPVVSHPLSLQFSFLIFYHIRGFSILGRYSVFLLLFYLFLL